MIALLRLCRPYYAAPMALTYLLTVYYATGGQLDGRWLAACLSTAALALVIAAGYALNDVCDVAIDRLNAPHRPIPSGRVSRRTAAVCAIVLLAAGLALGAPCGAAFFASLSAVAAGLVLYDVFSKRMGAGKPLVVAALMTSIYPLALALAGGATGPRAATLAVFPAWLFPTAFGYELLKDLRDAVGDRTVVPRGTSLQRRPALWRRIAAAAIVLPAPLLLLPAWMGCKWVYLIGAVAAAILAAASAFVSVRRAILLVYAECLLAALAAAADVLLLGI